MRSRSSNSSCCESADFSTNRQKGAAPVCRRRVFFLRRLTAAVCMQQRFRGTAYLGLICLLLFGLLSCWQLSSRHSTALVKELTLDAFDFGFNRDEPSSFAPENTSVVELETLIRNIHLEGRLSPWNKQRLIETLFFDMINEHFNTSEAQTSLVSYQIISSPILNNAAKLGRFQNRAEIERYNALVHLLNQKAEAGGRPRLYIIPVDPLAWMKKSRSADYETAVQQFSEHINRARNYIRFKGSDHVFLCLSKSCQSFGEDFARRLSEDMGTRAIFASPYVDVDRLKWPCPLRVIKLEDSSLQFLDVTIDAIAKTASVMVEKRNRWICSNRQKMENYFGDHNDAMSYGGIYMEEYGFLMCQIPKSGSTMLMMLLRRMMHAQDWNSTEDGLPHNPLKSGVAYLADSDDPMLVQRVYEDPEFITAAIVRHPIPRLLSAYLDKIVALKEYGRVGYLPEYVEQHGVPSFSEFVDFLIRTHPDPDKLEQHFLLQSSNCGLRDHKFDFVGSLSDLGLEFEEFSKSLGFWEKYVASGWGKNAVEPFGAHSFQSDQRGAASTIWEYYTEELMWKVYDYYKEDFIRFGFTVEEMLATIPRR